MRRIPGTWLLVAIGVVSAGCNQELSTPTDPAVEAELRGALDGEHHHDRTTTYAVIGDVPYGATALAQFPGLIDAINQDPDVRLAVHVGDIKSGSTECSDDWYEDIATDFSTFDDPLVYSIGDNEWTDCHRANNGGYNPLDRLAKVREVFFSHPGWTLGAHPMRVDAEPRYPENQRWEAAHAVFATFHVIGSNNGLDPWFGDATPPGETPEQTRARELEVRRRNAANVRWLKQTFAEAREEHAAGVVLFLHADLYHPGDRFDDPPAQFFAHEAFVEEVVKQADRFDGPVLIISGDSHNYRVDTGSPWLFDFYNVSQPTNVTQIIVDRSIEDDIDWLKLTVDPSSPDVFSWEQVFVP